MAEGKIKYTDIFAPDVAVGAKELTDLMQELSKTVLSLKDELKDIKSAAASNEKSFAKNNKILEDTVEVTEDLTRLQKEEINLKKRLAEATSEQAVQNEALKVELADVARERKNAVKLGKAQEGSMAQLAQQLALNRKAYRELSKEQRNNEKVGGRG